jgi:hypothetical protein
MRGSAATEFHPLNGGAMLRRSLTDLPNIRSPVCCAADDGKNNPEVIRFFS